MYKQVILEWSCGIVFLPSNKKSIFFYILMPNFVCHSSKFIKFSWKQNHFFSFGRIPKMKTFRCEGSMYLFLVINTFNWFMMPALKFFFIAWTKVINLFRALTLKCLLNLKLIFLDGSKKKVPGKNVLQKQANKRQNQIPIEISKYFGPQFCSAMLDNLFFITATVRVIHHFQIFSPRKWNFYFQVKMLLRETDDDRQMVPPS